MTPPSLPGRLSEREIADILREAEIHWRDTLTEGHEGKFAAMASALSARLRPAFDTKDTLVAGVTLLGLDLGLADEACSINDVVAKVRALRADLLKEGQFRRIAEEQIIDLNEKLARMQELINEKLPLYVEKITELKADLARSVERIRQLERQVAEGFTVSVADVTNDPATLAECGRLKADLAACVAALTQIAKGEGEFSRDPLKHAENVIESHKEFARAALARVAKKETT